jgi:hypothetical protein
MQPDMDLFVVARRIAADHDRARAERLAGESRAGAKRAGPRTWLGRHLISVGIHMAGEPARPDRRPSALDHPC